jgi:hypothetical protein
MRTTIHRFFVNLLAALALLGALSASGPALATQAKGFTNLTGPANTMTSHNATWVTVLTDTFTPTTESTIPSSWQRVWFGVTFSATIRNEQISSSVIPCSLGVFVDGVQMGKLSSSTFPSNPGNYLYTEIGGEYHDNNLAPSLVRGTHEVALKMYSPGAVGCVAEPNYARMRIEIWPHF